jgi:hypothetical protein
MEEFCSWFRDGAGVDKGDDVNEGGEVREVGWFGGIRVWLRGAEEGKGMKEIDVVGEGAGGGALLGVLEGFN